MRAHNILGRLSASEYSGATNEDLPDSKRASHYKAGLVDSLIAVGTYVYESPYR
jgi:hypothetical protein